MHPILFSFNDHPVPTQWLISFIALMLGLFLLLNHGKRRGTHWKILIISFIATLGCGLVGARLFVLLSDLPWFSVHVTQALHLPMGGMHIYGGILGAMLGSFWVCIWYDEPWLTLADTLALVSLPTMAVFEVGNFFHGSGFGTITTMNFATSTHNASVLSLAFARHPLQLYMAFWLTLLFFGMLAAVHWKMFHGELLALLLVTYPLGKTFLELSFGEGSGFPTLLDLKIGGFDFTLQNLAAILMIASGVTLFVTLKSRRLTAA